MLKDWQCAYALRTAFAATHSGRSGLWLFGRKRVAGFLGVLHKLSERQRTDNDTHLKSTFF